MAKQRLFGGVPHFDVLVRGESHHPGARNFVTKSQSPWGSPQWRFCDSRCHRFDTVPGCDGRTDRRTDRHFDDG